MTRDSKLVLDLIFIHYNSNYQINYSYREDEQTGLPVARGAVLVFLPGKPKYFLIFNTMTAGKMLLNFIPKDTWHITNTSTIFIISSVLQIYYCIFLGIHEISVMKEKLKNYEKHSE